MEELSKGFPLIYYSSVYVVLQKLSKKENWYLMVKFLIINFKYLWFVHYYACFEMFNLTKSSDEQFLLLLLESIGVYHIFSCNKIYTLRIHSTNRKIKCLDQWCTDAICHYKLDNSMNIFVEIVMPFKEYSVV